MYGLKRSAIIAFTCISYPLCATPSSPLCDQDLNIRFERNNIFDPEAADFGWLHQWANALHIKTKKFTLENESAFFLAQCDDDQAALAELERLLRSKKYLRDAEVSHDDKGNLVVKTWDTWSLTPTLGFGRKGGKNKFSVGIKERNLLGLGVDTELRYFTNAQRKGYKVKLNSPLFMANQINLGLVFTNTNDGRFKTFSLAKPFVSFNSQRAFHASISADKFTHSVFHNGITSAQYQVSREQSHFDYHWLASNDQDSVTRYFISLDDQTTKFNDLILQQPSPYTPNDRNYQSLSFGIHYQTKHYKEIHNTYLINQIEDINLGWSLAASIGVATTCNSANKSCFLVELNADKGWQIDADTLALFSFDAKAIINDRSENNRLTEQLNRITGTFSAELFYSFSPYWRLYAKSQNLFAINPYKDGYSSVGGTSGVRGYAIDYQQGKAATSINTELRYYPNINIYQLLNLGAAAFLDVGKSFGQPLAKNSNSNWLASVGTGIRLYSPHASDKQVVHLDLALPLTRAENVNRYEIRISAKKTF